MYVLVSHDAIFDYDIWSRLRNLFSLIIDVFNNFGGVGGGHRSAKNNTNVIFRNFGNMWGPDDTK